MRPVRHFIHMVVAVGIAIGAAVIVANATQYIAEQEVRRNAVVNDWRALNWRTTDQGIAADVYGVKNRDCSFVRDYLVSAIAYVDGVPVEVSVSFLSDTTPGSTRPKGAQSFGVWEFSAPQGQAIQAGPITIPVVHICAGSSAPVISSIHLAYRNSQNKGE